MNITTDFLRDEVRSGFYIPTAIKQAWAVQLQVLAEIDRICRKYDITYFADWGTLLGTIRHGGYIPWDDDLDICMKREDYVRFRQVADKELPKEFAIHDYERKEDHWLFLARVINRNQICFEEEHLNKHYNFPYIATVDIFVLDYLYEDETKEQKRCEEIKYLIALADKIVSGEMLPYVRETELSKLETLYNVRIDRRLSPRELGIKLYRLAEEQMARVPEEASSRIGQIFPWVLKGSRGLPKVYYEKVVRMPFEMTTMPVPSHYHLVLQNRYGDYFKVHKVWEGHDYPYFEGQRKNLQAEADFELPQFTFQNEMLRQVDTEVDKSNSLKGISKECLAELGRMLAGVESGIRKQAYGEALAILPEIQQLTIDLGTLIENVKGEDNLCVSVVIPQLEQFCEVLFALFEVVNDESSNHDRMLSQTMELCHAFEIVENVVQTHVIEKKEIVFVTSGAKQWKGLESLYNAAVADPDTDVCVVPVPLLQKNVYGQVLMSNDEILSVVENEGYPEDLGILPWNSYSLEMHHPDVIFIQDPYDGENECLTIPSQFYAKNLQKYTGKLVYVPAVEVDEFGKKETSALYNTKHYVTAPGVVCADLVIVQSESTKKLYVEKLVDFGGEDTREIWEKKILPLGLPIADAQNTEKNSDEQRKLLFCIGCNAVCETKGNFIEKLQEKISVMKAHHENLRIGICMYPHDINAWYSVADREVVDSIVRMIKDCESEPWCEVCNMKQKSFKDLACYYDAYYGSPTPLAHLFNHNKKPVMLG